MSASTSTDPRHRDRLAGMVRVEDGTFAMGSARYYPEEAPVRRVRVDAFWIDTTPVTNARFAAFVAATGHVTFAEVAPDPRDYPGMLAELAVAGSLVFEPTPSPSARRVDHAASPPIRGGPTAMTASRLPIP